MAIAGRAAGREGGTRPRLRAAALVLVPVVLLALAWRVSTVPVPALAVRSTLAAYVRLAGAPAPLAWPREGQAAVEVPGVGSLGSHGSSQPVPIASVAKVMTAYLTLLEHPLLDGQQGFSMTVTAADAQEEQGREALGESTLQVAAGERLTERQALQALLLPSANNIAAMLAVHDAGSIGAFVARMNATARRMGMRATTYTDPSGFEASTVSTAADQLKLARTAMAIPAFAALVDERSAVLPLVGRVENYNALVGEDGYVGIKTGSDSAAGGCLVFAKRVLVGTRRLMVLGVVLGQRDGSPIEAALASARALGDSAARALRVRTAIPARTTVLAARAASGQSAAALTATAIREIGWPGLALPVRVVPVRGITRLRAGQPVGQVSVGGTPEARAEALASRGVGGPSLGWRLRHLL